ncbi:mechanosensitive channel MscK [Pasteurella atlantica]|uniref:mechanosensitive channel MscK n=1 Tax=Pasteurellaceae TaxID=712 RepID=UPI002779BEE7|nr:mechanosensitive channel MscK [Pasteurella atlantica]MDP8032903.1 mechanosensitive channel MscK [Pasteurella atlantica]MDP8034940.1 mechanosensitive channel MscK [Pasteurella atlantica]MDP8036790.1 mechanosensitive channel MscK [Pasteurella atlantica]MDP8047237.1 mechanosensitive channel MscK [Pasteurella atlantica]MDP8049253.1 mechanosensitive channel MscK [Pasteurella atlantica]
MRKPLFFITLFFTLFSFLSNNAVAALPTEAELNIQLKEAKKNSVNDSSLSAVIKDLEESLTLLEELQLQKQENQALQTLLTDIDIKIQQGQTEIASQTQQPPQNNAEVESEITIDELQQELEENIHHLKTLQEKLAEVNSNLVQQNTLSTNAQTILTENTESSKKINALISDKSLRTSLKNKYLIEQKLLHLKSSLSKELLKNNDKITLFYQTQYDLLQSKETILQNKITTLQAHINKKRLQQSQEQFEQVQNQQLNTEHSQTIQTELNINTELSKQLLSQTKETNTLSQAELRLRNILDNLTQTQRTLKEQISALKGTLVLSRIIQKQKQKLPLSTTIKDLPDQISELRVRIFDMTQKRNELYVPNQYIEELQKTNQVTFSDDEIQQLNKVLAERKRLLSDSLTSLNNQLNLSINLELVQKQVSEISQQIEDTLVQQSFWVKSNAPINTKWLKSLPKQLSYQLQNIIQKFNFSNSGEYLTSLSIIIGFLIFIILIIYYFGSKIKQHLALINGQINSLNADSQWHTPIALFYNTILTLPRILWFLVIMLLVGYFCFSSPLEIWKWSLKIAGYLWLFSFILSLFSEKGIAVKHFGLSEESCQTFQKVILKGMMVVIILLNVSIFTNVTENGIGDDVIGQIISIFALIFCIFILAPSFKRALNVHNENTQVDKTENILLTTLRLLIQLTPIGLIALISIGYYYTALKLISLTITSYIIIVLWLLVRYVIYRAVQVASRRLAYRRLQEQRRNKVMEGVSVADDIISIPQQSESIKVGILKSQIIHITNIILWVIVASLLYNVWSELIVSADYLNNISLWKQTVVTENGTEVETITLFNLLIATIILTVMYLLVRNIRSILEIFVFSRIKLSQGTPYTITTLLTYAIVAIGSASAFSSLGMSWAKLQWLFAALSVGLGFGLQEIFANFISGIIILFERPVRIGDVITVGEFSGTVSRIRIRATTLMDFDGKEVIVPNKNFVTERLTNWALSSATTRVIISIGVAYGSDLDLTKKLLLQAAEETETVLDDPAPVVYFLSFGASTLDHELRVYVGELADRNTTVDALNRKIDQLFAENGIEIAFNQLDVFIKNQAIDEAVNLPKDIAQNVQAG